MVARKSWNGVRPDVTTNVTCMAFMIRISILLTLFAAFSSWADAVERSLVLEFESDIMATKGHDDLTFAELHAFIAQIPRAQRANFLENPTRFTKFLTNALLTKAMANRALENEVLEDPEVSAKAFTAVVKELAALHQERYLQERQLDDYTTQAKERFLRDREKFVKPARVTFDHILLRSEEASADEIEKQVSQIIREYEEGRRFHALIQEYSDDPSVAETQGRVSDVPLRRLDPDFAKGITEIAPGSLGIVESSYGTHIVLLHSYQPERQADFKDVADQLRREARESHRQKILQQYVAELSEPDLQLEPGAIRRFLKEYGVEWNSEVSSGRSEPMTESR